MNTQTTPNTQANFIQPRCYLSKDGKYLTLVLPGNLIVRKHVNYFKQILGVPYERTQTEGRPE